MRTLTSTKLSSSSFDLKKKLNKHVLEIILLVIVIVMTFASSGFLTGENLLNILRNMALQGCIAFGMTIVIIAGEIDLSIGSTVALTGVIIGLTTGKLADAGMSMDVAVIVGILVSFIVAGLIGLFNGWILTKYKVPSFIITLAMLNVIYGIAAVISKGFPVTTLPSWYNVLGAGQIFSIPIPAIILLIVFAIIFVVMNYTTFGRSVYAVGGNPESARLSGIHVSRVKIICMVIVQLCSALSGVLVSSQVMSGSFNFGKGWEMIAISSVIIGGTSLFGGVGKVWGTFIGLIFLGVIINAMTLLNVNEYIQYIVRGLLILTAVLITTIQLMKKRN
ncbi:ABC transporter permease [Paenibacillus aceris]|uniref:Ribose/xylose/arabinose/galactoside ABC-type transport system permease subunit n=1 Tax=Paenibacillus aceris TaxID=869555 RepID=A0ABS4I203_9BACL|nr:ABC transporter permease [Paenibacillus aceris]MBP1964942.1 ribose/xylose/arabinose/galactoside ABC-type transport system permease subunit [Paenibacillus aceris]NHW35603.1 ABC transporter permease [Paenibacillus aceris]